MPPAPITPIATLAELEEACGGEEIVLWTAQDLRPGVRAWRCGAAVAVAAPGVCARDRIAVHTAPANSAQAQAQAEAEAARLARHAAAECGPTYRLFGEAGLITRLAGPERPATVFSWMSTRTPPPRPAGAHWLEPALDTQVAALLADHHPGSYATPGMPGVHRWAGARHDGALAAVAADAWSTRATGFLAGVATAAHARGHGLARRVCAFVTAELLTTRRSVALMVDDWNTAAIAVYEHLGYTARPVASAPPPET
ncbi:GNAT superfamily N-acetyltransferase [Thermocatellispora tengchongensis]|uniref:GNAT superfamily N-acetyltransferase n=1 Tax=Thermocatellispora tengchongensis TaxID=1073253 RepID=A0A840PBM5_9ACTN|nr:GNAT family N-acetyltransferase [Thermocatellispora tengchongensis]MBB5137048.1 GNAT superfamily N-acetyltransferase [Thermocatellispora tengchongensis]